MSSEIKLSKKQEEIVRSENGPIYVKASAGSGKTRVLTEKIRFLLGKTKKKILALTFTNKAGKEIKERLSDIPALENRVFIGTFHGFCQKVLENHGHLIGFDEMPHIFEDENDRLELIEKAMEIAPYGVHGYRNRRGEEQENSKYKILRFISEVKRNLRHDFKRCSLNSQDKAILYKTYQELLREQNAVDFDDLLLLTYELLTIHSKIADLYARSFFAVCIDEAQDLNHAQYQLLVALTKNRLTNIIMVGDPNQSIFHFTGSSKKFMDEFFVKDYKPEIIELKENYRSSKSILSKVKKIFPQSEDVAHTVKQGIFHLKCCSSEKNEAEWVIEKISKLILTEEHDDIEGKITYEKIAILARNKYIFIPLEEQLKNKNIPFYYRMALGSVTFESSLMEIFSLALRVRLNPQDELHKRRLMDRIGLGGKNVNHIKDMIPLVSHEEGNILQLTEELHDDGSNFKALWERFKDSISIADENEKNIVFFKDIEELLKHWFNYAKENDKKSLNQFKNSMALGQTHPLTQHQGVTLSTVHTMKGQEFDIVFLIGMDDGTFPDYRATKQNGTAMTQEQNNLYVALTRAKRFLYVTWPRKRKMPWGDEKSREISRFLKPLQNCSS